MRRLALLALALAATSLAITAVPSLAARPKPIPPELRVPEGHRLVLSALGRGVQIYDCPAGTWVLREPAAAILRGKRTVAVHYAGPTWQSLADGSKVTGGVLARVDAPRPQRDIPWLLLQATSNTGAGVFAQVDFIQRLRTAGGVAPTGACDPATRPSVAVPYRAVYTFWAPAAG